MSVRIIIQTAFILLLLPCMLNGQANQRYADDLKKIKDIIERSGELAYKYTLTAEYPNGQKAQMNGDVYVGNAEKILYNSNDYFTMLYTDKWYYRADHKKETVTIVNLEKHLKKDYKGDIENDVFSNGSLIFYFDSVVLRYATVKIVRKKGDNVEMELSFTGALPIRSIVLSYDEKDERLTGYRMQTFKPWRTNEFGKNKGTTQTVVCSNFRKVEKNERYKTDNFFTIKKSKAVLKKYKKYKSDTVI